MLQVFHRSRGGRVTAIEMFIDEAAVAIAGAPHEWAADQKSFAPWPEQRNSVVALPSTAAAFRPNAGRDREFKS